MQVGFRTFAWRVVSYFMLFILVLTPAAGVPTQAAQVGGMHQTERPAAPGDHLVTAINMSPDTPNIQRTNHDQIDVTFDYITNEPGGVYIYVRPFTNGAPSPNYAAHPSPLYPMGSGDGDGYFRITSGTVEIDEIRIQMWNSTQTQVLFEVFLPVYFLFSDADHLVTDINLSPDTPDVLKFEQEVSLRFNYLTREPDGVRIWARPFSNGALTPNYSAHPSPLYQTGAGSGTGFFYINQGTVVVDQIRIQMWDGNGSVLLFEAFLPVYYRYMNPTNIVTHIEFNPDTPNVFSYSDQVDITFNYTNNFVGGVRIWARPFSGTSPTPSYAAHGSGVYPVGSGGGNGWFRITSGPAIVDKVRVQMWDAAQTVLLYEAFLPVHLVWAGAGPPPGPDMEIDAIEVTQAIQDLNNSVDLVAGKRTYVRVHVSSPVNNADVYATLSGKHGWVTLNPILAPGNPGGDITVRPSPDRGQINDSFWFELPSSWTTAGNLTLTARLDPNGAKFDPDTSDNVLSTVVNFKTTPPLRLRIVNVQYTMGGSTYLESNFHLNMLESWLRRAYPINNLVVSRQTYIYPTSGLPDVDTLHGYLALIKILRILFTGEDPRVVYYGVVDDGGDFMRGKALDIPSTIAAGPSGTDDWGWDFDGSYNDWYGGHEIGHTRGRGHANYCGAGGGGAYPYTGGRISPSLSGNTAIYGFDITTRAIYAPSWKDVMTYCNNQWVSDFTYEGIRSYLVGTGLQAEPAMLTASNFLAVMGLADLETNTAALESAYVISQDATVPAPDKGDWSIVLLNADGGELASYSFAPDKLTDDEESEGVPAVIAEVVPWIEGTNQVEIRYLESVVDSRETSANAPSVQVNTPGNGLAAVNEEFTVSWTGSDLDGDNLLYSVLYSNDGGISWQTLIANTSETQVTLDTAQLPGGSGVIRVLVSDGLLSGQGDSGVFDVPLQAPSVEIIQPDDQAVFFPAQPVTLHGSAFDLEDGTLDDSAYSWSSSIDGVVGSGEILNISVLTTGEHVITLTATDSDGLSSQAQRTITIAPEDTLEIVNLDVAPYSVGVTIGFGEAAEPYTVTLRSSGETEVDWEISEDIPWLSVDTNSGVTPFDLTLTFDSSMLRVGNNMGVITLTSETAENSPIELMVTIQVTGFTVHMPVINRE